MRETQIMGWLFALITEILCVLPRDRKGEPEVQIEAESQFKLPGGLRIISEFDWITQQPPPRGQGWHPGAAVITTKLVAGIKMEKCPGKDCRPWKKVLKTVQRTYHRWWRVRFWSSQKRACERISNNEQEQTTSGDQHGLVWVVEEPNCFSSCFSWSWGLWGVSQCRSYFALKAATMEDCAQQFSPIKMAFRMKLHCEHLVWRLEIALGEEAINIIW